MRYQPAPFTDLARCQMTHRDHSLAIFQPQQFMGRSVKIAFKVQGSGAGVSPASYRHDVTVSPPSHDQIGCEAPNMRAKPCSKDAVNETLGFSAFRRVFQHILKKGAVDADRGAGLLQRLGEHEWFSLVEKRYGTVVVRQRWLKAGMIRHSGLPAPYRRTSG